MHWRFDKIFSIQFFHQKTMDHPLLNADLKGAQFTIIPMEGTREKMRRMGWIFKPMNDGIVVFGEKSIDPSGNAEFRSRPANNEVLTFLLLLEEADLLNYTHPFKSPLPPYSGRTRLLYFDNLSTTPPTGEDLRLTGDEFIHSTDLASGGPLSFQYLASEPQITSVELQAIRPETPPAKSFPINPPARTVGLEAEEGAYRLTPKPGGTTETVFLTQERFPGNAFGCIRIFNTAALPMSDTYRKYQAVFANA